jgi:hypothetical protein
MPIASSDLINKGLNNNNNFLMSAKQKSLHAIGMNIIPQLGGGYHAGLG